MNFHNINTNKVAHGQLILEGTCLVCGHCGQALTDAVSIERGIGPICSKKGYNEDPKDGDEIQAFIELAEYQELVEFLTVHYKPNGLRGLMNGLVKVCSLNRRQPVHKACCNAIEALGYKTLASTLRKSISSVFITKSKSHPGSLEVRVLKSDYSWRWRNELNNNAYGVFYDPENRTMVVPVHKPDDETALVAAKNGETNREVLWNSIVHHYSGLIVTTPDGNFEIKAA